MLESMKTSTKRTILAANKKLRQLTSHVHSGATGALVVIAVFGVVGAWLLTSSRAATPTVSIEAENGTSTPCAVDQPDTSASKGSAVKFTNCGGFTHPGILLGTAQLNFTKSKIGTAPWNAAYTKMSGSHFASLSHTPDPAPVLSRNATSASGAVSLNALQDDDIAAYTDALMWYYTGNAAYADKAIAIMNAWSSTLTSVDSSTGQLDAAWASEMFPRAAEIIRYTYTPAAGHPAFNVTAFSNMLTNILLPQLDKTTNGYTYSNGNWGLSFAEGTMNIGIFTDNRAVFNTGVQMWRERVPAYVYETSDGALPNYPPGGKYTTTAQLQCFWDGAGTVVNSCGFPSNFPWANGLVQETCRDISHATFGLEAMVDGAETARLQGVDLYGEQQQRIVSAFEFTSKYDLQLIANAASGAASGPVADSICGTGSLNFNGTGYTLGFEEAYNAYATRKGVAMPYTLQMVNKLRPTPAALHMAWESLTFPGAP